MLYFQRCTCYRALREVSQWGNARTQHADQPWAPQNTQHCQQHVGVSVRCEGRGGREKGEGKGGGTEGKTATDSSMCLSLCLSPWWHTRMPSLSVPSFQVQHNHRVSHWNPTIADVLSATWEEPEANGKMEAPEWINPPGKKRKKKRRYNSLSHHPLRPSVQTSAAREPCCWKSLKV